MNETDRCRCEAAPEFSTPRRKVIQLMSVGLTAPLALRTGAAESRPAAGDRLVLDDAEGAPVAIKLADLQPGKPLLAFPFDPSSKLVRNESRFNKIVLMRFADAELNAASREVAAGGVLGFSAICTHQNCEVKTWLSKDKALICFCHSSKFQLLEGGAVSSGPASRALPILPLKLQGDELVVAATFQTPPGGSS